MDEKKLEKIMKDMEQVDGLMKEFVTNVIDLAKDDKDAFLYLLSAVGTMLDTACSMYGQDKDAVRRMVYRIGPEVDEEMKRMEEMSWFS